MPTPPLDGADIQGLLFHSYKQLPHADYRFFRLTDPSLPFALWLSDLIAKRKIASIGREPQGLADNLALGLTATGLVKLLGFAYTPDNLPSEFVEGMIEPHRSRLLGDIGANDPGGWLWGHEAGADRIDGVLISFASNAAAAKALGEDHVSAAHGMTLVYAVPAQIDGTEPFGFRDGISQPVIKGTARHAGLAQSDSGEERVQAVDAGEFVLGYLDGSGNLPRSLSVSASADIEGVLPAVTTMRRELRDFGRNGTFMVIRQLRQDVEGFAAFTKSAAQPGQTGDDIAEKMVGRRKSGAALALGAKGNNDFDYTQDLEGLGCPVGAHVRRANPRASVPAGSAHAALAVVNRHRIIRRGRRYELPGGETGLVFVALNASISRQFEFVQSAWCNNPVFGALQAETDPLSGQVRGAHPDAAPQDRFTIPASPYGRVLTGLQQWVTVRGGGYFFLPGLTALGVLARNAMLPADA